MSDEYYTEERCYILEILNTPAAPDASIARARVEPGVTTRRHRVAGTVERYAIIEGEGIVHLEGRPDRRVAVGDQVRIPAGLTQSITNTGDVDLIFLCVCTPRFERENYASVD